MRKGKIMPFLLAGVMVFSLSPIGSFNSLAEEPAAEEATTEETVVTPFEAATEDRDWADSDFEVEGNVIKGLTESGKALLVVKKGVLTIPDTITASIVGKDAFKEAGVTAVVWSSHIKELKESSFEGNGDLTEFNWGTIGRIETAAFKNCGLQGKLEVPAGFWWIGNEAFQGNKLSEVVFPDDIKTVGHHAFADNEIEKLTLGKMEKLEGSRWQSELNIENKGILSYGMFKNNKIKEIEIPEDSIWAVGVEAFANNDLQTLTIPSTLQNIYRYGFYNNPNLETVIFATKTGADGKKKGIRQIDRGAFEKCNISKIELPEYLGEMGGRVFLKSQIKEITLPDGLVLGYYVFALNPLEKVEITRYAYGSNFPEVGTFSGTDKIRVPLKNVSFKEYTLNPEGRTSTTFFAEQMFRYGMLKSIEAPYWINTVKKDAFLGNEGWYEGTKQVAVYRKNDTGKYVVSNEVADGEDYTFNPVLFELKVVDQNGESFEPEKAIKLKRVRKNATGASDTLDLAMKGGVDYTNFKLGDEVIVEFPDLGQEIKFSKTNAKKEEKVYTLSLAADGADMKTEAYGDGYEVGYKKIVLEVEYTLPKVNKPKPDDPKPPVTPPAGPNPPAPPSEPPANPPSEPTPAPTPEPPTYRPGRTPSPSDPASPEVITVIGDDGVPLGTFKKHTNPDGTIEYINEDNVPLGDMKLVATGNEFPELPLAGMAVVSLLGIAFVLIRQKTRS